MAVPMSVYSHPLAILVLLECLCILTPIRLPFPPLPDFVKCPLHLGWRITSSNPENRTCLFFQLSHSTLCSSISAQPLYFYSDGEPRSARNG